MPPVSILEHPGTAKQLWPLSVEAYHALGESGLIPEKTELLYGFVFNKMPKSPLHSFLTQLLYSLLSSLCPTGFTVRQEQPITCPDSEPEPDIALVKGSPAHYRDTHPLTAELVIEVAVNSKDYDRDKAAAYAGAGVKELWLLLVPEQQIEIHSGPTSAGYASVKIVTGEEIAACSSVPAITVSPATLFQK